MKALLWSKGWSVSHVEESMDYSLINRDVNGLIDFNATQLNLEGDIFKSVDGVTIDLINGTFELLMTSGGGLPSKYINQQKLP
jgi:hypothetical protein